jgi:hypothetical protein
VKVVVISRSNDKNGRKLGDDVWQRSSGRRSPPALDRVQVDAATLTPHARLRRVTRPGACQAPRPHLPNGGISCFAPHAAKVARVVQGRGRWLIPVASRSNPSLPAHTKPFQPNGVRPRKSMHVGNDMRRAREKASESLAGGVQVTAQHLPPGGPSTLW